MCVIILNDFSMKEKAHFGITLLDFVSKVSVSHHDGYGLKAMVAYKCDT